MLSPLLIRDGLKTMLSKTKDLKLLPQVLFFMEHRGFEPLTSTMRTLRATNCANAPYVFPSVSRGSLPRFAPAGLEAFSPSRFRQARFWPDFRFGEAYFGVLNLK